MANIARHAAATEVRLEIATGNRCLRLLIRDNGLGFDPHAPSHGQGLADLRYRATEMRGQFRLDSAPGQGTEIELRIPLPA